MNYNYVERTIASWLSYFPFVKRLIKRNYQFINLLFYRKSHNFNSKYPVKTIKYENLETFFGYYDKSPLNAENTHLIFHASEWPTFKKPNPNYPLKIVLFDNINNSIIHVHSSHAYNWQQGSRLQWIDNENFIFNDFDPNKKIYISKLINIRKPEEYKVYNFPIYDTFEKNALTLNYSRLAILRPDYGYRNLILSKNELYNLENDGVFLANLHSNEIKLLISLKRICQINYHPIFEKALHKVNHIMFSPSGDKFVFLHRYIIKGIRYDRLILSDINGQELKVLSDHHMVSHYDWVDNDTLIVYMQRNEIGKKYFFVNTKKNTIVPLGNQMIDNVGDGHPSVFHKLLLFDTYPDKARMKKLFIYNLENENLDFIGEFFEPMKYHEECRCDLHPRWSYDGKKVFIDSVHSGLRQLCMIELNS